MDVRSLTINLYTESKVFKRKKSLKDSQQPKRPGTKTNLRDYQKHASNYDRKAKPGNYQSKSVMHNTVQGYLRKQTNTDELPVRFDADNTEEEIEDMMFPSERPNQEIPVPHSLYPMNNERFTNEFTNKDDSRITKNDTNLDSKAVTEVSYNTTKKLQEKVRESSTSLDPHYGQELEVNVNKSEHDNDTLPISDSCNESPIKNTDEKFDFK
jgi:hypothetical protein